MPEESKPQVIVAQLGARMHYAVPVLLHRAGMLAHFYTDAYVGKGSSWHWLTKVAPLIPRSWQPPALARLLNRQGNGLPAAKVTAFNLLGYQYVRALAHAADDKARTDIHLQYGERFCQKVLQHNGGQGEALYAFQGAALPLFHHAPARGWRCFFEQFSAPAAIMYPLYQGEHQRWPGWEASDIEASVIPEVVEREHACWRVADRIICASEFVRQGLISQGMAPAKIQVVPYGVDINRYSGPKEAWNGKRPLRVLFVGGVTIRKGVQYLYEALRILGHPLIETRLVGPVSLSEMAKIKMGKVAELTGQVPRSEIAQHYQWADLFVFPSICEGSATVCYEALASSLPVITTPNAGSVVRDGIDGFIVPIRNPEALAVKIDLLARDPALLYQMSQNAQARARDFGWNIYGKRLVNALVSSINTDNKELLRG